MSRKPAQPARGLWRFVPRGGWLVLVLLVVMVYHEHIPSFVWTLAAGIVVVAIVYYYWLGLGRGRRK